VIIYNGDKGEENHTPPEDMEATKALEDLSEIVKKIKSVFEHL